MYMSYSCYHRLVSSVILSSRRNDEVHMSRLAVMYTIAHMALGDVIEESM